MAPVTTSNISIEPCPAILHGSLYSKENNVPLQSHRKKVSHTTTIHGCFALVRVSKTIVYDNVHFFLLHWLLGSWALGIQEKLSFLFCRDAIDTEWKFYYYRALGHINFVILLNFKLLLIVQNVNLRVCVNKANLRPFKWNQLFQTDIVSSCRY